MGFADSHPTTAPEGGFDRTYISLVERSIRSPAVRAVVKLAEVLRVRPSEIVQRMETCVGEAPQTAKKVSRRDTSGS